MPGLLIFAIRQALRTFPCIDLPTLYTPLCGRLKMMNRNLAVLTLAGLLSSGSLYALAAETTKQGSALPPTALPGINQAQGAESNEDKADKKGEEASGSNSGADSKTLEKEAASSSKPKDVEKKQGGVDSGG